ncbi:MAG: RNA-processing protein [Candidatus Lokiarchaeota archaeon]|nr:RNA-processing protein [Candidatus Lokiarchaeota archaeon]
MKVSKNRIAVLIGKGGETKEKIENILGVKLDIDSKSGDIEISPEETHENFNQLNLYVAQKIVKGINRGFNPVKSLKLIEDNYELEIFNLLSILGKSQKRIKRIKGRIIGRDGEMRKAIERYAECYLSVYGKTVSIIADYENLQIARKAVSMLINGMPHHTVLKFLEKKYNEKQKEQFRKIYKPEF